MGVRWVRSRPTVIAVVLSVVLLLAQNPSDELERNFKNPPDSAKPRVWWHWVGGNVTKEGITKDLEWMKRVGIGGMQMFDVGIGGGQIVDKKIIFMTPEWFNALRHAASEADRLGLEMSMAASGGWSETGGPWVKPEQAMKKVVWSELRVNGPQTLATKLPEPPSVNGPIRDLKRRETGFGQTANSAPGAPDPTLYRDTVVLAYQTPEEERALANLQPKVSSNAGPIEVSALLDDSLETGVDVPIPENGQPVWIQFEFPHPFTARALSIALSSTSMYGSSVPIGKIEAGNDGTNFSVLATLPGEEHNIRPINVRTFAFPQTTAT